MSKKSCILHFMCLLLALVLIPTFVNQVIASTDEGPEPFIYAVHSTPYGFDPQNFYDMTSNNVAINHLEGLYAYNYTDPKAQLIPRLAKNMGTWNEAGTAWTIPLREDVTWCDGTSFTAEDVKWNWDRLNYLAGVHESQHSSLWYNNDDDLILNRTEMVDDHTIKFILNKPWMDFFYLQAFSGCFLIKPIEGKEHVVIENIDYHLIEGNGPFILDEYVEGSRTVFLANDEYYRGAPNIKKMIFKLYARRADRNQALMDHEVHLDGHISTDNRTVFDEDTDLDYFIQGGSESYFLQLNVNNIKWSVRKAMQYACNYESLTTDFYGNAFLEHRSPIPDGMLGYNPNLPGLPFYDLFIARQYLKEDAEIGLVIKEAIANGFNENSDDDWKILTAGEGNWGDITGPLATYKFYNGGSRIGSFLIDNMALIGIEIDDWILGSWFQMLSSARDELTIVYSGWCPDYWHPINQIEPIFRTNAYENWSGLNDTIIDTMMDDAHTLYGTELETKIDEIVTAIIVDQAAAMYWAQTLNIVGYSAKHVSCIDDLSNTMGEKYFYNIQFTCGGLDLSIPGYPITMIILNLLGYVELNIYNYRKRKILFEKKSLKLS